MVSVFTLIVFFDAAALLGGFFLAWLRLPLSFAFFLGGLGEVIGAQGAGHHPPERASCSEVRSRSFAPPTDCACSAAPPRFPRRSPAVRWPPCCWCSWPGHSCRWPSMAEPVLVLEGVTLRSEEGRLLFDDLDWSLPRGACVQVRAPFGGDASPLLRLVAGLAHPQAGRVLLDGPASRPLFLRPCLSPSRGPGLGPPGGRPPGEPEPARQSGPAR